MHDELSQLWALATLVDQNGQVLVEQLSGRTADSAHPMNQGGHGNGTSHGHISNGRNGLRDQAYFFFPDLAIHTPGRYRVRVTLMRMNYSYESPDIGGVAVAEDYVDSRSILVEEGNSSPTRPSKWPVMIWDMALI
jgi:hypothetical protein